MSWARRKSGRGKPAKCSTARDSGVSPAQSENSNTNGTVDSSGNYHGNSSGGETAVYRVVEGFVIEGDQYVYLAQEHLYWRWSKAANVTVNGPVKYAIEKRKLYVMDEDGKEHEMEIVKKTLRLPEKK